MDNKNDNKPKPDDRSDNVDKLQDMVENTIGNIEKSEETIEISSSEVAKQKIREKNKRREEAIEGMRQEIQDEYNHNKLQ